MTMPTTAIRLLIAIAFACLFAYTVTVSADESICGTDKGAALALCTAYYEVMACDGDFPKASQKACDRIADNYRKITGSDLPTPMECGTCFADSDCEYPLICNAASICLPSCVCPVCDVCSGYCVADPADPGSGL